MEDIIDELGSYGVLGVGVLLERREEDATVAIQTGSCSHEDIQELLCSILQKMHLSLSQLLRQLVPLFTCDHAIHRILAIRSLCAQSKHQANILCRLLEQFEAIDSDEVKARVVFILLSLHQFKCNIGLPYIYQK